MACCVPVTNVLQPGYPEKAYAVKNKWVVKRSLFTLLEILSLWQDKRHIKRTAGGKCILLLAVFDLFIGKDFLIKTHL